MDFHELPGWATSLSWILAATLLYPLALAIYRLYLHPLSCFPGPKVTAVTLWYEFYYDVIRRGQFTWRVAAMHERYGPIVRINPHELHVADPDFYDVLYAGAGRRTEKYPWMARMFGVPGSMVSTVDHHHHRVRRGVLSPFFSSASVARLESAINTKIDLLCKRIREKCAAGQVVQLELAFTCLTTDIITEYSFGKAYGVLEHPDFAPEWYDVNMAGLEVSLLNRQVGWLFPLMNSLPVWLVKRINPNMMVLIDIQTRLKEQIEGVMADAEEDAAAGTVKESREKASAAPTVFHEILHSDIPAAEKSLTRLREEAQTVVAAGTLTTAHFLTGTAYHILANPPILHRLLSELRFAIPSPNTLPPAHELEKLPYLTAVVNEGFRVTYGITSRLTRVAPDTMLTFRGWTIPAGTPVGMTSHIQHNNADLFPNPAVFDPERFLGAGGERRVRHLVTFSKGTRNCLGMNLARAEIYLTLAALLRRFDFRLYETERGDVDSAHDFFSPRPKMDSKGLRVTASVS